MAVIRPLRPLRAAGGKSGKPVVESRLQDFVVITGFSGAGKSTAMNVFEDAGYFCVDNLPPEMIRSLVELFVHKGSKVERAAVVSDVRGGVYFEALRAVVIGSKLIAVTGRLQREGEVVHIVAEKAEDWTRALSQLSVMGPDLQAIARADEIKQPLPGRREPVLTRPPELFDAMPLPGLPEHQDARRAMPKGRNFQ